MVSMPNRASQKGEILGTSEPDSVWRPELLKNLSGKNEVEKEDTHVKGRRKLGNISSRQSRGDNILI